MLHFNHSSHLLVIVLVLSHWPNPCQAVSDRDDPASASVWELTGIFWWTCAVTNGMNISQLCPIGAFNSATFDLWHTAWAYSSPSLSVSCNEHADVRRLHVRDVSPVTRTWHTFCASMWNVWLSTPPVCVCLNLILAELLVAWLEVCSRGSQSCKVSRSILV